MTQHCEECGHAVSDQYARVFAVDGVVECCPACPDYRRGKDGRPQRVRSPRSGRAVEGESDVVSTGATGDD